MKKISFGLFISFLLFLCAIFPVWAEETEVQSEQNTFTLEATNNLINLKANQTSFKEILNELEKKTGIKVKIFDGVDEKEVTLNISSLPIYALPTLLEKIEIENFAIVYDKDLSSETIYILPEGKDIAEVVKGKTIIRPARFAGGENINQVKGREIVTITRGKNNIPIRYVKDELLLKFHLGVTKEEIEEILKRHNLVLADDESLSKIGYIKTKIPDGREVFEVIKEISKEYKVKIPEPNYIAETLTVNDPLYGDQWYVQDTNFDKAWDKAESKNKVKIAVIDTGVNTKHPDLKGKILKGYDYVNNDSDASDDHGHGTFVAGIVSATANNIGIKGLYDYADIIPLKVIDVNGLGTYEDTAKGIIYAVDNGAKVINLSIGSYAYSFMLQDAVDYAFEKGSIVVAAGGNDGMEQPIYPADYADVIGVSALGYNGQIWISSNSGNHIDVTAPGVSILSTGLDSDYVYSTGTSASAPMVSALAGMLVSEKADLSSSFIERLIMQSAKDLGDEGRDKVYGSGEIDALASLEQEVEPFHDVAVRSVSVEPMVFEKGKPTYIVANIENVGTYKSEEFDVVLFEIIGEEKKEIGRQEGITVIDKTKVIFEWKPDRLKKNIKFEVSVFSEDDENSSNNSKKTFLFSLREENGLYVLYAVEPPVHEWIAYQAFKKLENDNPSSPLVNEMKNYLPINSNSPFYSSTFDPSDDAPDWDDSYNAPSSTYPLIEGAWEEDKGERNLRGKSCHHFWDPDVSYDEGLHGGWWMYIPGIIDCRTPPTVYDSALEIAQEETFINALNNYSSNKAAAYYWLGRTAHLLMDLSVPEHVLLDPHPLNNFLVGGVFGGYEYFVAGKKIINSNEQYKVITSVDASIPNYSSYMYNKYTPTSYDDDLTSLFYKLSDYTNNFDSDDRNGRESDYGLGKFRFARNELDAGKTVDRVELWVTLYGLPISKWKDLEQGVDYDIVNNSCEYRIYYYESLYNQINNLAFCPRVYYDDGTDRCFNNLDENWLNDIWDEPLECIYQPELESRAIGYVAALYQLFWERTHPSTATLTVNTIPVDGAIYVDGVFKGIGYWSGGVDPGSHTVTFGYVEGYITPPPQYPNVPAGETRYVTGVYTEDTVLPGDDLTKTGDRWEDNGTSGDDDAVMEAGESPRLHIRLRNEADPLENVDATLSTNDSDINITDPDAYFDNFGSYGSLWSTEFKMDLNFSLPEGQTTTRTFYLHVTYRKNGQKYYQDLSFTKKFYWQGNHGSFAVTSCPFDDSPSIHYRNNGNSVFESGEEVNLRPMVDNTGQGYATHIDVSLVYNGTELLVDPGDLRYPNMDPGDDPKGPDGNKYFWIESTDWSFTGPVTIGVQVIWEEGNEPIILPDACQLNISPNPIISAQIGGQHNWDFGVTTPGDNVVATMTVRNAGSGILTATDIQTTSNPPDTTVPDADKSFTLAPGATKDIQVTIDTSAIANGTTITREVWVESDARLADITPPSNKVVITGLVSESAPIYEVPDVTGASDPDISGDWICWHDARNGNDDIFAYQISTGIKKQITSNEAGQYLCKISGNLMVWGDNRNRPTNDSIYGYDLSKPELGVFPVYTSPQIQHIIGLDGNLLAFVELYYFITEPANNSYARNLLVYDYLGEGQFSSTPVYNSNFSYSGGHENIQTFSRDGDFNEGMLVVERLEYFWNGSQWGYQDDYVEVIDFAAGETSPRRAIDTQSDSYLYGAAAHSFAYTQEDTNYDLQLWLWTSGGGEEQLTSSPPFDIDRGGEVLAMSEVGGNKIIVYDKRGSDGLYYMDRDTGDWNEYVITPENRQYEGRMDGNGVVWLDYNANARIRYTFLKQPDISIPGNGITFSNDNPLEGESIDVSVLVKNLTDYNQTNDITVRLYDGDPDAGGIQLGSDEVISGGLAAHGETTVQFSGISVPENQGGADEEIHEIYARATVPSYDYPDNNTAMRELTVSDNDVEGPIISNVVVEEYSGDGDSVIGNDEQIRISWSLQDPSGISSTSLEVDGSPITLDGDYFATLGPLAVGDHELTITATDDDNSPESSTETYLFTVVYSEVVEVMKWDGATVQEGSTVNLGTFQLGAPAGAVPFYIYNRGEQTLSVTDLTVSGNFTKSFLPTDVSPDGFMTFTITPQTDTLGVHNGQATLSHSDSDQNPFSFNITAEIVINYYCDLDSDGHMDSSISGTCAYIGCVPVGCQTTPGDDCDDGNDTVYPGATEVCDGLDNDCNGVQDGSENLTQQCGITDVGECTFGTETCDDSGNWFGCTAVFPVTEICDDGLDNDCDGDTDGQDTDCVGVGADIWGRVELLGLPVNGKTVKMRMKGETNQVTTTDSNGEYQFNTIVPGKNFRIFIKGLSVPSHPPANPDVWGNIMLQGSPVNGKTVKLRQKGAPNQSTTTDSNGEYQFNTMFPDMNTKVVIKGLVVPLGVTNILITGVSIAREDGVEVDTALHLCPDGTLEEGLFMEFATMTIDAQLINPDFDTFPATVEECTITYLIANPDPATPIIEPLTIYPNCTLIDGSNDCSVTLMDIQRKVDYWNDVDDGLNLPAEYPTHYIARYNCIYYNIFRDEGEFQGEYDIWLADWDTC